MAIIHKYEIISNSTDGKVVGSIWWDGKQIDCDVRNILDNIKGSTILGKDISDGLDFFNVLSTHFKNGYITLRRVK